ncbi:hypothetical protein GJAV_G00264530 [Gymnothorax javanicus]|nr:hypothetical protein GJAV_G00264530 [Gymnothorax javanicus]
MTEETHPDDDSYIVRVKAVVMTRDDSSGGWLVQEGGGLSRVGVCKVLPSELIGRSDFLIHGERLKDKQVILKCFLKKDLIYTKATPTFHHWKVDNRKCGLSFQSPADARAFDRGVRKAMEDLTEGSTTSSSTNQNEAELGDDDVFANATDSSSNSSQQKERPAPPLASPSVCDPRRPHCILGHYHDPYRPSHHHFLDQSVPRFPRRVSFLDEEEEIVRINPRERTWLKGYEDYRHATAARDKFIRPDEADAYVQFAKSEAPKHDYTYPYSPGSDLKPGGVGGVVSTQPRPLLLLQEAEWLKPQVTDEDGGGDLARCVYCREVFSRTQNGRGRCQDAPDPVWTCIRRVSCLWCADSLLYHCMSDPEGEYTDPCSCDRSDPRFCLRWLALASLSLIAPCMCCYLPLRACYHCGVACHCCGGRHKA